MGPNCFEFKSLSYFVNKGLGLPIFRVMIVLGVFKFLVCQIYLKYLLGRCLVSHFCCFVLKVKQALAVLIKHGFVTFERGRTPMVAEYKFAQTKVSLLLRYPR